MVIYVIIKKEDEIYLEFIFVSFEIEGSYQKVILYYVFIFLVNLCCVVIYCFK